MNAVVAVFSPSLRRLRDWLRALFGRSVSAPAAVAPQPHGKLPDEAPAHVAATAPTETPIAKKARKKTRQARPNTQTLVDLLDSLDDSFHSMNIPHMRESWLPKKDVRALYRLGVYVCDDWKLEVTPLPALPHDCALPALASAHFIPSKYDTHDSIHPRFIFAIKAPRLPPSVEQVRGTAYQFGMSVELNNKQHDKNSERQMFWVWAWFVVRPDGAIEIPSELRPVTNEIRHRRNQAGERTKGARSSTLHQRRWQRPSITQNDKMTPEATGHWLKCEFRQLILWWASRDDRWSVGVRKDGRRVTFSIDKQHTSAFFSNRKRQVTENGRTRPIIHYVEQFTRSNGSVVAAHVRGLSNFTWRGYECTVVAPKLRGAIFTTSPLSPVEIDPQTPMDGCLTNTQLAIELAGIEDAPRQPANNPPTHRLRFACEASA